VIQPYLRNKKDKTFMDHFLLGNDLAGYTTPWAYGRLNAVERVLLGERAAAEKARVARQLKEQLDLVPANVERYNHLFNTALRSGALTVGDVSRLDVQMSPPVVTDGKFGGFGGRGRAPGAAGAVDSAQRLAMDAPAPAES